MNIDRFPDALWPRIEELLIAQYLTRAGGGLSSFSSLSVTESTIQRAKRGSIKSLPCRACGGLGHEKHGLVRKPCEACTGTGAIKTTLPKVSQQSRVCKRCNGSGIDHPVHHRWRGIRPQQLNWCLSCADHTRPLLKRPPGYVVGADAGPGENVIDYTPTTEQTRRSWISGALVELDKRDSQSALVLELAYGSQGDHLDRSGQQRLIALWILTPAGESLLKYAAERKAHPTHWSSARVLLAEIREHERVWSALRAGLIRQAEDCSMLLMVRAKRALSAADAATGARVLKLALAMERRELSERRRRAQLKAEKRKQQGYRSFNAKEAAE